MASTTPPLAALRSFASFVRLGSIAAAAEATNLTPGAIAHQIRALESHLTIALVDRTGRQLVLTPQGRAYGYKVRNALDEIAMASGVLQRPSTSKSAEAVVRVSALPSFANGWLLPRIAGFFRACPNVRLVIDGTMEYADLNGGVADCAIRFGQGAWPDTVVEPLMQDSLILVAAPTFLGETRLTNLSEVVGLPLLTSTESWTAWVADIAEPDSSHRHPSSLMEFTDSTHLVEAARLGLGLALTRRSIADNLIQRHELVKAFDHEREHNSSYYLVYPKAGEVSQPLAQFVSWLKVECDLYSARERGKVAVRRSNAA